MQRTRQILDVKFGFPERRRFPIRWSAEYLRSLRELADSSAPLRSPLDDKIAAVILLTVEGLLEAADGEMMQLIGANLDLIKADNETFISAIFALFVLQQFSLLAAIMQDRFDFKGDLSIDMEDCDVGAGQVRWDIAPSGAHRFVFGARSFQHDNTRADILVLYWTFPLYAAYARSALVETGSVMINLADIGWSPGLSWCDARPDRFLIPDCVFIPTHGYDGGRDIVAQKLLPWEARKDVAFWRGGTTGIPRVLGDWRTLDRIVLCEMAKSLSELNVFDVGISSIVQIPDPDDVAAVKAAGLLRGYVPWDDWGNFRYLIDIDGNTNAWSALFQRLLSGSTVLKVMSRQGFQQWYYDRLIPWVNFVPIAPDMSDLLPKLQWLRRHQTYARRIGESGRQLALSMTFDHEIARGVETIGRCFRYFRGETDCSGPFGREAAR